MITIKWQALLGVYYNRDYLEYSIKNELIKSLNSLQ